MLVVCGGHSGAAVHDALMLWTSAHPGRAGNRQVSTTPPGMDVSYVQPVMYAST